MVQRDCSLKSFVWEEKGGTTEQTSFKILQMKKMIRYGRTLATLGAGGGPEEAEELQVKSTKEG